MLTKSPTDGGGYVDIVPEYKQKFGAI